MSFHPPPTRVQLRIHVQLPASLAGGAGRSTLSTSGLGHLPWFIEGPVSWPDGSLFLVDLAWGRVLRLGSRQDVDVVADYDGEPNGLAVDGEGMLLVADRRNGLLALDPSSGRLNEITSGVDGEAFLGLNDVAVATDGCIYVTDQGDTGLHDPGGRLVRVRTDGRVETVLGGIPSPNGLVIHDDRSVVLVAVTRDNSVWRVPLDDDGTAGRVGRFVQLSGGVGPDGMASRRFESLLVAHLGMGVVWIFDERGIPVVALESPVGPFTTNVTFGVDGHSVFVTESTSGCVLTSDLEEWGLEAIEREGRP